MKRNDRARCWGEISDNQQRRLAAETAQEREERLRQLSHNHQCRMEEAIHNSCVAPARHNAEHLSSWRAGASQPSRTAGPRCRDIYIYIYIVRRRRAPGVYDVNIP